MNIHIIHDSVKNYPPLKCPLCGIERKPRTLNKDGSVSYRCPADHVNHGSTYSYKIAIDGSLIEFD